VKRLTFDLEFITPAFIGGAYQQAELRPASFVGLLRWWWRALKGECNIEKLKEEEIKIFGGDGKMASPVYLRVEGDVSKGNDLINEYKLSWNFDRNRRALIGPHAGVGYLYYSMVALNKKREFIKAGSRLRLTLIGKDEFLKHYIASLWALVFLGGVGARGRRGGGNLTVIDYNPKDLGISFIPTGYFDEWLVENLKRAKDLVGSSKTPCNEYSNLKNVKLVLSPIEFNTWVEALNYIGKRFMNFRLKNKQKVLDIAVFGLPIRYGKHKAVKVENTKEDITRRSSPLIIKVVKTPEGKYKWMVLGLEGKFLPDGAKLRFWEEAGEPNFGLIDMFFEILKERQKNE
jgi:CRISPR-associated protein Cmr1